MSQSVSGTLKAKRQIKSISPTVFHKNKMANVDANTLSYPIL